MKRFYHVYFLCVLWELHTYCVLVVPTPSSSPSILPKSLLFPLPKVIPSLSFLTTQCYPSARVWLPECGQPSRVTPLKKTDFAPQRPLPHSSWTAKFTLTVFNLRSSYTVSSWGDCPVMSRRHGLTAALPTSASNGLPEPPSHDASEPWVQGVW